jgi:hypothetical protein
MRPLKNACLHQVVVDVALADRGDAGVAAGAEAGLVVPAAGEGAGELAEQPVGVVSSPLVRLPAGI